MSIEVVNSPFSAGDVIETANVLNKHGICIGSGRRYGYFIFIEPRLLLKMKKLMFIAWVAKPNGRAL
jgi:hypothetical protein